jgi:hypothetical protein
MQWLLSLIYFSAAKIKWEMAGSDWANGFTIRWYLVYESVKKNIALGYELAQHQFLSVLMSWGTLFFEATFFLILIFPFLKRIYVPIGIALHAGIFFLMKVVFFQYLALFSAFVDWSWWIKKIRYAFQKKQLRSFKRIALYSSLLFSRRHSKI